MAKLAQAECVTCNAESPVVTDEELSQYITEIPEWKLIKDKGISKLQRVFKFNNFEDALKFTNAIGELANIQGHHPTIILEWGKVTVTWWTHAVNGLHRNDFIMSARSDFTYNNFK